MRPWFTSNTLRCAQGLPQIRWGVPLVYLKYAEVCPWFTSNTLRCAPGLPKIRWGVPQVYLKYAEVCPRFRDVESPLINSVGHRVVDQLTEKLLIKFKVLPLNHHNQKHCMGPLPKHTNAKTLQWTWRFSHFTSPKWESRWLKSCQYLIRMPSLRAENIASPSSLTGTALTERRYWSCCKLRLIQSMKATFSWIQRI